MGSNGWKLEDEIKLHEQLNRDLNKIFEKDIESIRFETKLVRNLTLFLFFLSLFALLYLSISDHSILKVTIIAIGLLFCVAIFVMTYMLNKSKRWFKKALDDYIKGGKDEDERYLSSINKINYNGGI